MRYAARAFLFALLPVLGWSAQAGQVQLAPTRIQIDLRQQQGGFTVLRNAGTLTTTYRVTVVRWQQAGQDTFSPTRDLVVNPLQFTLKPGQEQTIRLAVRTRPTTTEQAYRVVVEEQPVQGSNTSGSQVNTLLRVTLPVFVRTQDVRPTLVWRVEQRGTETRLVARNSGTGRALIADLVAQLGAQQIKLSSVNVISGGEVSWALPAGEQFTGEVTLSFTDAEGQAQSGRAVLPAR